MTDEPIKDREDSAETALNSESKTKPIRKEPWAKTSSGEKDKITSEDDE
jgi:hypothetical protein